MAYKEKAIINQVLIDGSKKGRMFRANAGRAWQGKKIKLSPGLLSEIYNYLKSKGINTGFKILINPRIFHGMPAGFPDTFGWESQEIASLCCGSCKMFKKKSCPVESTNHQKYCICYIPFNSKKIAIFKATECKTGKQKLTKEQQRFKEILEQQGGIYEVKTDE